MIEITVNAPEFRAGIGRIMEGVKKPRGILVAVGMEAAVQLRAHYLQLDRGKPNKLGGPRQHFWLQVRRSVQNPVLRSPTRVTVSVTDPRIGHKIRGGRIVPKRAQFLAIPAAPDAYGLYPRVYERERGVKLVFLRTGNGAVLARAEGSGMQVEYILRKSVNQAPDPNALPPMGAGSPFLSALIRRAEAAAARQI